MRKKTAEQWITDMAIAKAVRDDAKLAIEREISSDVRIRRELAGVSQQRFAEMMETSSQRVSHLECCRSPWTTKMLRAAYAALERLGA